MKQYRSHLRVIGFLTGLMIAATFMLASSAHSDEFCNSTLGWFDKDMNPVVKIVRTPCEVGNLGDNRHTEPAKLAGNVVAVAARNPITMIVESILVFVVTDRDVATARVIAFSTRTKFYIYLNGESNDPNSVTEDRMDEYIASFMIEELPGIAI